MKKTVAEFRSVQIWHARELLDGARQFSPIVGGSSPVPCTSQFRISSQNNSFPEPGLSELFNHPGFVNTIFDGYPNKLMTRSGKE